MPNILTDIEKAVRNICRGENAFTYRVGLIQARIVKVLQEEGVMPLQLLEKGLARPLPNSKIPESLESLTNDTPNE